MISITLPRFRLTPSLAAWRGGTGPHLLLIHGVGLNADAWYAMLPELSQHFTITAIDMPGHGESAAFKGMSGRSLDDYTTLIANAIEAIDVPVIVVGHSMGALIAMDLAIRHPTRVVAAVMLNAIFRRPSEAAKAVQSRANTLGDNHGTSDCSETLDRWFGPSPTKELAVARQQCDAMLKSADPKSYAAAYRIFAYEDGPPDQGLQHCEVPMLFITGSDEPNSTPHMSRAMAEKARYGDCVIIEDARHMMPITHARAVNQQIIRFTQERDNTHG